ncbi:MAG TPA: serine/threonine-protein kinase [Tepidisphaeraceae bacterium]|jgi:serine/threonine-protein kinase|nr:serine/threonine-protein kinase [Tepidisphaeraceae bacterium]
MSNQPTEQTQNVIPRSLYGYEVVDFLGEGAGSMIYAASHPVTHQIYALKHVAVKVEKDQRFVEQLINEYEIGEKVTHPLLRRCVELKVTKPLLRKITDAVLVMELVEGTSCETRPPTKMPLLVDIFHQTATALGALHQQNFIHCDLKPNNILVTAKGQVKIIDFGQACPSGSVKKRIQGTPDFISPEQVRCEPVTVQTDVYNLGATFYWLLSGSKLPTLFTLKKSKNSFLVADAIPQPHELNPKVPENLSNLVMECVRITQSKRPASMTDLCRRLEIIRHTLTDAEPGPVVRGRHAPAL